jgi:hypothetical protein
MHKRPASIISYYPMKINSKQNLSTNQIQEEISKGGKFVHFQFTVSYLVGTYKGESVVRFIRPGVNAFQKGIVYSVITILFGWWGFPAGPRKTIQALRTNWKGGRDVTDELMATIDGQLLFAEAEKNRVRHHILEGI